MTLTARPSRGIPIVGPLVGGVVGILLYDLVISDTLGIRAKLAKTAEIGRTRPMGGTDEA